MGKLDVHSFHPGAESPPCPSVSHSTLILSAQPSRSSGSILLCLYKSSSHRGFGRVCVCQQNKSRAFFFFFFLNKSTHAESLHVLTLHRSNNYTCFVFFLIDITKDRLKQRKSIISGQSAEYAQRLEQSMNIHVAYMSAAAMKCVGEDFCNTWRSGIT